jgi:hypothetical protein
VRKTQFLFLALLLSGTVWAETRRALLVGIDQYTRPDPSRTPVLSEKTKERLTQLQGRPSRKAEDVPDLEGSVNDAVQLRELFYPNSPPKLGLRDIKKGRP